MENIEEMERKGSPDCWHSQSSLAQHCMEDAFMLNQTLLASGPG
jgi:hypothetical protein